MAEYIDRKEVFGRYEEEQRKNGPWSFRELISSIPAADVAPVKHGHWIVWEPPEELKHMIPSYFCSVCNKNSAFVVDGLEPIPPTLFNRLIYSFCPHCGAKMDEK